MGYRTLLLLAILALITALKVANAEGWYCENVASEWSEKGKMLQSCGIGKGLDENAARLDAYNNARKEFDLICNKDTTCANKVINIDPQRSECRPNEEGSVTCHRLFYYHVTDIERKHESDTTAPVVEQKTITNIENKTEVHNQIQNVTNNSFVTIRQPLVKEVVKYKRESDGFRSLIRVAGRVSLYSTNNKKYQGVYLTNPTESEIDRAIIRGNRSGGMNAVYIYNP